MGTGVPSVRREPRGRLLPLRRFRSRLDKALSSGGPTSTAPLVAVVEIDRLDVITAGLGRIAGDAVLQEAAVRLTDALPDSSLAAILGGSRFAVAVPVAEDAAALDGVESL